jgi:hypothetical protein
MALETWRLGVAGKKCLWLALEQVRDKHEPLATIDLARLIERASSQEQILERERMAVGAQALGGDSED